MNNKIKGVIVISSAIGGFMLLNNQGNKQKTIGGNSDFGFTATKPATGNTTTTIYNITEGSPIYNESPSPSAITSTPTKKSSSSNKKSPINNTSYIPIKSISNVADYDALPEGKTKKAFSSIYPTLSTPNGGTMKPTYGLGAGGTAIITPPKYEPKKVTTTPTKTWYKPWSWF